MTLRSSLLLRLRSALQRLFGVSGWQSMLLWSIVAGLLGTLATELFRATLRGFEHLGVGTQPLRRLDAARGPRQIRLDLDRCGQRAHGAARCRGLRPKNGWLGSLKPGRDEWPVVTRPSTSASSASVKRYCSAGT